MSRSEVTAIGDGESGRSRGWRVSALVALAVLGALVGLGVVTGQARDGESAAAEASPLPVTVEVARVERSYRVEESFVGRVEARRSSQLGFELGGLVKRLTVDEGAVVDRGALLAELDTDRLEARRRSLVAQQDRAEADARLAELTLERVGEARALDAVSSQALDEAELGLAARRASAAEAGSAVAELEVELAKSRLTAPYDAVVVSRLVDEGQVLGAGTPVFHVLERGQPEARVGVAGGAVDQLVVGQEHRVVVGDREVVATVRAVSSQRRSGTRAVEVLLTLDAELVQNGDDSARAVHSGDLARLVLSRDVETAGFWLPMSALTESSRGLWAVYVVADGVLERRELEVLHEEADRVFARGTLEDGERFVRGGLHRLVPGQRVRVEGES
ncbi:MAG: efflux RND transporter periplasmic adaptor subunit [Acidobacteriota bacterium]